jgi:hypothetical protein
MSGTLKDAPPPTSISQMEAIANLWDLFEFGTALVLLLQPTGTSWPPDIQRFAIKLDRVATPLSPTAAATPLPAWTSPPQPASFLHPLPPVPKSVHITLHQITFDDVALPRVTNKLRPPILLHARSPIAYRTRSCSNAPLALFAGRRPYHEWFSYHIPTPKLSRAPHNI